MRDALIVSLFSVLPRNRTSRVMGWAARRGLSRLGVRAFVAAYGVDLSEAEGDLSDFDTLDAFFTRHLKPGARPIAAVGDGLVSPVDGVVAYAGPTVDGCFEVAPGRSADIGRILGMDARVDRDVCVLYLSPKDYHRVHSPTAGSVTSWRHVPGTLWPVFPSAVRGVRGLFGRNERVVSSLDTPRGALDVVMVGAFGVGHISMAFADVVDGAGTLRHSVTPGGPFGVFHLGSTVILAAPVGTWTWAVTQGDAVRMGQALAH